MLKIRSFNSHLLTKVVKIKYTFMCIPFHVNLLLRMGKPVTKKFTFCVSCFQVLNWKLHKTSYKAYSKHVFWMKASEY